MEPVKRRETARPAAFLVLPLLGASLVAALALGASYGPVNIPLGTTIRVLLNHCGITHFPESWTPQEEVILLTLRLPRALSAAVVGAGLATAGALFQGLL